MAHLFMGEKTEIFALYYIMLLNFLFDFNSLPFAQTAVPCKQITPGDLEEAFMLLAIFCLKLAIL